MEVQKIKSFKQLDLVKRVKIEAFLGLGKNASYIANELNVNRSTITREINNYRQVSKSALCKFDCACKDCFLFKHCNIKNYCSKKCNDLCRGCPKVIDCNRKLVFECKLKTSFPYVCNGCSYKENCPSEQIEYNANVANYLSNNKRKTCREGINLTEIELYEFNETIKKGIEKGQSIYHITETGQVEYSASTIYNYIDKGFLLGQECDLLANCKLKKRKLDKKYHRYNNKGINREGRTFNDFIVYKIKNKISCYVQMDFLGVKKDSEQQILCLHFLPFEFIYIAVFNKNCVIEDIISLFNNFEAKLGFENFNKIFHTLLTDRDVLFNNYQRFEQSSLDKNIKRMNIFYCDPASSAQKSNVENSNKQLRKIFLKDDVIENVTPAMISAINSNINSRALSSLNGMTAYDAFKLAYGKSILKELGVERINSKNVKIVNYREYKDFWC